MSTPGPRRGWRALADFAYRLGPMGMLGWLIGVAALVVALFGYSKVLEKDNRLGKKAEDARVLVERLNASLERASAGQESKIDFSEVIADDAWLERLESCPAVTEVTIDRSRVTPAGLKSLQKLPSLAVLVLGDTPIDGATLAELAAHKNLVRLNISHAVFNDDALPVLATLPKLELLRIVGDELTGAGFASLAPCKSLTYLIVGGEKVDDSLLKSVEPMDNIRSLYLLGTAVTDAALYQLQQARPDLHIH